MFYYRHNPMINSRFQSQANLSTTASEFEPSAPSAQPTMESKLRKLLLRVHPDLFSSFPAAKSQNEQSLKRLNEFLETLKPSAVPTSSLTFPLLFFLLPTQSDLNSPTEGDLQKVEITLRAGGSGRDKYAQLGKLFDACGLGKEFSYTATEGSATKIAKDSIEAFLFEVGAEAARRRREIEQAMREVWACQHALQLQHRTRVTFEDAELSVADRTAALKQLLSAEVLKAFLPVRGVRGGELIRFIIADRCCLDAQVRAIAQ